MGWGYTELALTLGNWGRKPLAFQQALDVAKHLQRWSRRTNVSLRLECYAEMEQERKLVRELLNESDESFSPLIRLEPRGDRWRMLRDLGVREAVFEVPVGDGYASIRFSPDGANRAPEFARESARGAMLESVHPEIALTDITRADPEIVREIVERVEKESAARSIPVRWRLVDDLGLGDPLPGGKKLSSLAGWIRWLERELNVSPERVSVQTSDARGLALANMLAGVREGATAAASLFGLGLGTGWAASEQVMLHQGNSDLEFTSLLELREQFVTDTLERDEHRPVSGGAAWEMLGGSAPEELDRRYTTVHGLDPVVVFGTTPLPLLTSLSGHAGMLHLMHRHYPEHHFESDDPRSLEVSEEFERQFSEGRQIPVTWDELYPKLASAGLFEPTGERKNP